jgi:hypothetical protein
MRSTLTGILVLATVVFAPAVAHAQTISVGPYYATPSWDQTLACSTLANCPRFVVLANMNSDAVLDRETGLVWEKTPDGHSNANQAKVACAQRVVGDRQGWRLPTVSELRSLIQPSRAIPALPDGHPFTNVHFASSGGIDPSFDTYWTSTPDPTQAGFALTVNFLNSGTFTSANVTFAAPFIWCVRGGQLQ